MKANRVLVVLLTFWWEIHAFGATTPRVAGQWPGIPRSSAQDLSVQGDTLFARMTGGIAEIDVSNPAKMRRVGTLGSDYRRVVPATGNYILEFYVGPLRLLDMTDRTAPVEVSRVDGNFVSVAVAWPFVYTWNGDHERLETYDYSDPAHPIAIEGATVAGEWPSLKVQGDLLAGITRPATFTVFDISNRTNLVQRGAYPGLYLYAPFDLAGQYAYVTDTSDLIILDMQNNAQEVGRAVGGGFDSIIDIVAFPNYVWVSRANSGIQVLNVMAPSLPRLVGGVSGVGPISHARRGNYVFASDFLRILAFDATVPESPAVKGLMQLGVYYGAIRVAGNVGYLAAHNEASHVLDLSDPARPVSIGTFEPAYSLDISGDKLFLIDLNNHLKMFDISDAARPVKLSESSNLQNGFPIVADGMRAYATFDQNVRVINFSDPQIPRIEGEVNLSIPQVPVSRMIRHGTNLLASSRYVNGYLSIVNISDPAHPVLSATVKIDSPSENLAASGNAVYLQTQANIAIWDISNPANPSLRGTIGGGFVNNLNVAGNRLLVLGSSQLDVYDISSPFSPSLIGSVKSLPINMASLITVGDVAYIAGGESGLLMVQLAGEIPANPTLNIFNEGEMHRVRWAADYEGYLLQTAPTINGPWSAEIPGYSPFAFFYEATFASHTNRFYRLQK